MAIAYKAAGAGVSSQTSAVGLAPACPATVDAGDILIAHVFWEGTSDEPDSTPSGWTLLHGPETIESTIARHWVYGRIADGSEDGASVVFALTPLVTTQRAARIYSFSGYVGGTITDVVRGFAATSHSTDPQMPSVTTTRAGALAVALVAQNDNNAQGNATGESGGDWVEAVAEYTANLTPGLALGIQTCTPTADPGTVSGGSISTTNDPAGVIGFEIRDNTNDATLTADAGSFTETGTAANLYYNRLVAANSDTYSMTGVAASLLAAFVLAAGIGTFDETGTDAGVTRTALVTVDAGAYDLTGTDATVYKSYPIAADAGAYSFDGTDATLSRTVVVDATAGAFAETGTGAGLLKQSIAVADAGVYTLAGTDATLTRTRVVVADSVTFDVTGQAASVTRTVLLTAVAGTYATDTQRYPAIVPDSSGNQRHGTIKGSPTEITSPWAGFGTTLDLDGVDSDDTSDGVEGPNIDSTGTTDITMECRFRRDRNGAAEILGIWWDWGPSGNTYSGMLIYLWTDNTIRASVYNNNSGTFDDLVGSTVSLGEHTAAFVKEGTALSLYLDGTRIQTGTNNIGWPQKLMRLSAGRVHAGRNPSNELDPLPLDGAIDEFRLSKVARYSGVSYTPDSSPFTPDADTLVLWHFDKSETAIALEADRLVDATTGAYVLTGQDAGTLRAALIGVDAGAYTVTGTDVTFTLGFAVTAESGAFVETGIDAELTVDRLLTSDAGTYVVAGQEAALLHNYTLTVDAGTVAVTGTAAALTRQLVLSAAAGADVVTGTAADLRVSHLLSANSDVYTVAGTDANLLKQSMIGVDAGTYVVQGTDATITASGENDVTVVADPGAYAVVGQDTGLFHNYTIPASPGSVGVAGTDAAILFVRPPFLAGAGAYIVRGQEIQLAATAIIVTIYTGGPVMTVTNPKQVTITNVGPKVFVS